MENDFQITDIYDKNINFLFGSGASYGLFPTLAVNIKGDDNSSQTIEKLATFFSKNEDKTRSALLFMHYYKECIEPVLLFDIEKIKIEAAKKNVIDNYEKFIKTVLIILEKKKNQKKCNIFTTNYDGCFTHAADNLLKQGADEFIVNDGARGFSKRILQAKNFNCFTRQSDIFDRYATEIPQINLIHVHGSTYWYKDAESIVVDYSEKYKSRVIKSALINKVGHFSSIINDPSKKISDLPKKGISNLEMNEFWKAYDILPIVNPTKWKFNETVFEEHYYQMLRHLSYELEKPNSVFITFGFSFADEHLLNLIKRSLSNPTLQVFVSCFSEQEYIDLKEVFKKFKNIKFLRSESILNFEYFNNDIFTHTKKTPAAAPVSVGDLV